MVQPQEVVGWLHSLIHTFASHPSDGTVLTGAASGTPIDASGPVHASTLVVDVRVVGGTASGTFPLAGIDNHRLAGRAATAPASRMQAHTTKSGHPDLVSHQRRTG
jgi:hypothetical protein